MTTHHDNINPPRSYRELLAATVRYNHDKPALRSTSDGWPAMTWHDVGQLAVHASRWFEKGDIKRVSLISAVDPASWILKAGALVAGVDINPIYEDALADERAAALTATAPDLVAVDTAAMAAAVSVSHPDLLVVRTDSIFDDWRRAQASSPDPSPGELAAWIEAGGVEDAAVLLQSTGTTGPPTVIELGDSAMTAATWSLRNEVELSHPRFLAFLPAAHTSHVLINFYVATLLAAEVWIGGGVETIVEDLGQAKPNVVFGAPLLFDSIRAEFEGEVGGSPIGRFVLGRIERRADRILAEGTITRSSASVLGRLVGRFIARSAGLGSAEELFSGTSPLNPKTHAFFAALGWYVRNTYGLTECGGAATVSGRESMVVGELGRLVEGLELKLDSTGEVLLRGPANMRGKLGRVPVGPDEWLATGDLAEADGATFRFVGRVSNQVNHNGVETSLAELDVLAAAAGGPGHFATGRLCTGEIGLVVSPDEDGTMPRSTEHVIAALCHRGGALAAIDKVLVVDQPLCRERGELGATGKVRRWKAMERFLDDLAISNP